MLQFAHHGLKVYIEQWFNVLHKALIREEVSGLRPLLKQRLENPALNPEAEAVLTLQENRSLAS